VSGAGGEGTLPLLDGEEAGEGDAETWGTDAPAAVPKPQGSGRAVGRPAGAKNRKTAQLQKLYAGRGFKDPTMWQGELLTMPPVELWRWFRGEAAKAADELGLLGVERGELLAGAPTLAECIELQRKIAADLAPYLHGKMPIRIDHGDERVPVLIIRGDTDQVAIRREREALSVGAPIVEGEMAETSHSEGDDAD
jgi:hypothetical protein